MKNKKILAVFGIFALCFLCHFLYDWFPNPIFSIFFPVNESIFEHMKIIMTSYLLYGIIDYFLLKNEKTNNFVFQLFLVPIIGIMIYLIIYAPLYKILGENMFISIGLLFIIVIIECIMSYYLLQKEPIKYGQIAGILGIIIVYFIFTYLTYFPIHNNLFIDSTDNTYGIKKTT